MENFLRIGNIIVLVLILALFIIALNHFDYLPWNKDTEAVGFVASNNDADGDGVDDYTDILNGARKFVSLEPSYKDAYYNGGYPDDDNYVSTDIIWYALREAGYDFKEMLDEDMANNISDYGIDEIDSNIEFRKINNIKVFLDKYAEEKSLDATDASEWQGGDIVIFDGHIAIVSDKLDDDGINYIIHHDGSGNYEEDALMQRKIIGHYRFNLDMTSFDENNEK